MYSRVSAAAAMEFRGRRLLRTPFCGQLRLVPDRKGGAMHTLYVLYDERCAICKRLRDWILVQRSWIGLSMVAAGSARARAMFPSLEKIAGSSDLVVISDAGE